MSMRVDTLNDHPEFFATIGGREYGFSRLLIGHKARLQAFLRRTVPHPIDAIKPYLEGLEPADRAVLLENARQDAKDWPPDIGSSEGITTLNSTHEGRMELFVVALSIHQPEMRRADVEQFYADLDEQTAREAMAALRRKEKFDGGTAQRVLSVIMGGGDPAVEDPLPKGSGPDPRRDQIGASSTAPVNNGSE